MGTEVNGPEGIDRSALEAMLAPGSSGSMLQRAAYLSDSVLEWEREHLFARSWVCAGRSSLIEQVGSRIAVEVGGESLLLVRGDDQQARAFYNVCRHRGHELLACGDSDKRGSIHCPYHAWTYTLSGDLARTPRFEQPAGFEMKDNGLIGIRVEEWQGWIFVNLSGDAMPFAEHLGTFVEIIENYEPERLVIGATHQYVSPSNWKLPIENYHECYHCTVIHPELCVLSPPDSGDNIFAAGMWAGGTMVLEPHATTMSLDGRSDALMLRGLDAQQLRSVAYIGLFPNLLVSMHPDYIMTHRIEPRSAGETFVECQWLFAPEAVARPDFDPSNTVDFWDLTNRQDWSACEGVQRGLQSRAFVPGPFSTKENAVADWVNWIARCYLAGRQVSYFPT